MDGFIAELLRAFPGDYPPQLQVVQCDCDDCDECCELQLDFAGHKWTAIKDETIDRHANDLPLFTPQGLRYFIPAFLRAAMARPESEIAYYLMYSLQPSGIETPELSKFTNLQRGMIVKFLDRMADTDYFPCDKVWTKTRARWQPA